MTDDRVALILVDYPRQARLKFLGHVKILEGDDAQECIGKINGPAYDAVVERVFLIRMDAFDWNCRQHITPRFTEEQIRGALQPIEERLQALEKENRKLQGEIAQLKAA